jgi:hypothetical protein
LELFSRDGSASDAPGGTQEKMHFRKIVTLQLRVYRLTLEMVKYSNDLPHLSCPHNMLPGISAIHDAPGRVSQH